MKQILLAMVLLVSTVSFAIAGPDPELVPPDPKEIPKWQKTPDPVLPKQEQSEAFPPGGVVKTMKPVVCGHVDTTLAGLDKNAGEKIIAMGYSDMPASDGSRTSSIIAFNKMKGSYTVLELFSNGMACILTSGTKMKVLLPKDYAPSNTGGTQIRYEIYHPINALVQ